MATGDLIFLASVIFVAGLVRGITGFAGPLIMVPVLGFFTGTVSAIATSTLVDLSSNVSLLRDAWQAASRTTVLSLVGGALLTIPLGAYALLALDAASINRAMYAVVGVFSIVLLFGWRYHGSLSARHFFGVGVASGVVLGATSFGVTVMPFLFAGADSAARGRANFVLWALFCALIRAALSDAGETRTSANVWRR